MTKQTEALRMAIETLSWFDDRKYVFEAIQACKDALAETQEPVATVSICVETNLIQVHWLNVPKDKALLYTTPPSREWVGLSYEEILRLEGLDCVDEEYIKRFVRAIEAKLKEKNNG